MFARKRFGQHFLHDSAIIARIIASIAPQRGQHIVEIGPGLGAITWPLLQECNRLDVLEIDRDAIAQLRSKGAALGIDPQALQIHEGDALRFNIADLNRGPHSLRIVGNLPYNISTPLLFHLLRSHEFIADMHFMLQKEVVDRMAAAPGDDAYGRLTVMLAPWVRVESLFDIGPGAFRPPPKIMSTFFRLVPHAIPPFVVRDQDAFARTVSAAFSQRRKTLRNALRNLLDADAIASVGVDPGLRAEVISPAQFASLSEKVATTHSEASSDLTANDGN